MSVLTIEPFHFFQAIEKNFLPLETLYEKVNKLLIANITNQQHTSAQAQAPTV